VTFISRRVSVVDGQGDQSELSDDAFFSLEGPLVILGEPGAGKTELVRQFAQRSGSPLINASSISLFPTMEPQSPPKKVLIDGLDEITAYQDGAGIIKVLESIRHLEKPNFILTCRAVDWQAALNTKIILNKWGRNPIVGTVLPLNEQEIVDFVNSNGTGQNGVEFIRAAERNDVAELLKNPQNLLLLMKAVESDGWPNSRSKLYDTACRDLVNEDNEIHESLNLNRQSNEKLVAASGFICAQLLLAGKNFVCVDGSHTDFPRVSDLTSEEFSEATLREALSTKAFRPSVNGLIEPCHRTIAEFLGAKWLSKAITNNVSPRRLEALLYSSNYIVPSALRGLHAWLATLTPSLTHKFIERDPYGVFRYGDPSTLSVVQARHLLASLEKLAGLDPYFRSEDWHVTFGRGLAKPELREDILKVIRNPSTPTYLSHLILESIRGDDFSLAISEDLLELLCSPDTSPIERRASLEALRECPVQPDWKALAMKLKLSNDFESLNLAIDILEENSPLFSGAEIAEILVKYETVQGPDRLSSHSIGYGLAENLTIEQLDASLEALSNHQNQQDKTVSAQKWILRIAKERLQRQPSPLPATILSWFKSVEEHDFDETQWKKFSQDFFTKNVALRQALQTCLLAQALSAEDYRTKVFHLAHTYPGLWLRENDLIVQTDILLSQKVEVADWIDRWSCLVRFAKMHVDFKGDFHNYTRSQTELYLELKKPFEEIERQFDRNTNDGSTARERRDEEKRKRQAKERQNHYAQIADKLKTGTHLGATSEIAKTYLGYFTDFDHKAAPSERVAELVGSELQAVALSSLQATISNAEIPTVRQINELHAKEGKEFLIENILVAYGNIVLQSDQSLSGISLPVIQSMLASCHWGLHRGNGITSALQDRLEELVFADKKSMEEFLRDSFEPYLESGANHVSGLYRFAREAQFSELAGRLTIEWISKYENMSNSSLEELLATAIQYSPRNELIALVRSAVSSAAWKKDQRRKELWLRTLFLVDFEDHEAMITAYANETPDRIWLFRDIVSGEARNRQLWPKLSDKQNDFLIKTFGPRWIPGNRPSGWSGNQNPWDATDFIQNRIGHLAASLTDLAAELLAGLIDNAELERYRDHIKHLYAQQTRNRAEANKKTWSLPNVRKVLLQSNPNGHEDLQALLIDQLIGLQMRVKNSPTNDVEPFWDKDGPRGETYCRDHIGSLLTPYLERYLVRVHTEGTMPNNERCDLLGTHELINVPIEIKGQWHDEIWTAAEAQLGNYTQEYRAEGWGIYLVLWFGYVAPNHSRNPRGWRGQQLPQSLGEMEQLIRERYSKLPEKTKVFVLDLSKPQ
jgi:hypothetical protein